MITLQKAIEITRAKIATLRPEFQPRVHSWFDEVVQKGVIPYVYEGLRSPQRQAELYAMGRTAPGRIVTKAQPGQSFHNYGVAFDWVPLARVDKAEGMYEAAWNDEDSYKIGIDLAEKFNMRKISWETPHLEDATYKDWHELKDKFWEADNAQAENG